MVKTAIRSLQLVSVRWWNASAYYAVSLAEALNRAGHPAFVGGRKHSPPMRQAVQLNLPLFDRIHLETVNPIQFLQNLLRLRKFVLAHNIQLINAHRPEDHLYGALLGLVLRNPPVLVRTGSDVRPPHKHPINRWLHQRKTDFFIFSCRANLERYQSVWPIFQERSRVIYGGVDTDFYKPGAVNCSLRKKLNIKPGETVVGVVGRLSPTKDHETLLKAAVRVAQANSSVKFLISGQPVEISVARLRETAVRLGISERVIFLGKQEDVRAIIGCIDIGAVSSCGSEAISRITMEFLAMGKPVVVTAVNVLPELIQDGRTGFIVPPKNHDAMARRILELLAAPRLMEKMAQNARKAAVSSFSLDVFARQTLEVYRALLNHNYSEYAHEN